MDYERRHPVLDPLAVDACHELAVARPQAPQPYGDPGGSRRDTVTGPLRRRSHPTGHPGLLLDGPAAFAEMLTERAPRISLAVSQVGVEVELLTE